MKRLVLVSMIVIGLVLAGCANSVTGDKSDTLTLIGTWTANDRIVNNRTINEVLNFNSDGTWSIEGRYADTNELLGNGSGSFTYTSDTITYTTDPDDLIVENYSIDQVARKMTITTSTQIIKIWSRR